MRFPLFIYKIYNEVCVCAEGVLGWLLFASHSHAGQLISKSGNLSVHIIPNFSPKFTFFFFFFFCKLHTHLCKIPVIMPPPLPPHFHPPTRHIQYVGLRVCIKSLVQLLYFWLVHLDSRKRQIAGSIPA